MVFSLPLSPVVTYVGITLVMYPMEVVRETELESLVVVAGFEATTAAAAA